MRRLTSGPKPASRVSDMTSSSEWLPSSPTRRPIADTVEAGQVGGALARRDQVVRRQRVLEVRAGHLDDLGAQLDQRVDAPRGTPPSRPGSAPSPANSRDQAEPHAGQVAGRAQPRPRPTTSGTGAGIEVESRGSCPAMTACSSAASSHGTGARARGVQRGRERDQAVAGGAAVGRLGADGAGDRAGLADRAAGVGADRQRRLVGGQRRGRAAARAARDAAQVPRVVASGRTPSTRWTSPSRTRPCWSCRA